WGVAFCGVVRGCGFWLSGGVCVVLFCVFFGVVLFLCFWLVVGCFGWVFVWGVCFVLGVSVVVVGVVVVVGWVSYGP
ncbi:hypothetical protein, partial [Pseudomonas syringae group genomosp. 7]|uniref:hypothetical protein n=1 Tax=Pseudomonas syringae group genomosp. 7 TaxID=251699 RepID=UPI00376F47F9